MKAVKKPKKEETLSIKYLGSIPHLAVWCEDFDSYDQNEGMSYIRLEDIKAIRHREEGCTVDSYGNSENAIQVNGKSSTEIFEFLERFYATESLEKQLVETPVKKENHLR